MKKSKDKFNNQAFTLAELLVSATISFLVIIAGYSLSRIAIEANKKDESSLNLSSKVDNGLTFILDEVKSGKSLIENPNSLSNNCRSYNGDFLFAINLPSQAVSKQNYSNTSDKWVAVNCPIIYSLQRTPNTKQGHSPTYDLLRRGPGIDEKGFYQSTLSTTTISDSIDSVMIDKLNCTPNWNKKIVKGITLCFDPSKKAVEIAISAKNTITPVRDVNLRKTSGSFTRIVDEQIMGSVFNFGAGGGGGGGCMSGCDCNLYGTKIVKNKVMFLIDKSGSMGYVRIKGKSAMESAKEETIKILRCLKDGVKLQVIAFDSSGKSAFPGQTDVTVNSNTRQKAINFVSSLRHGGGTRPWNDLTRAMQDVNVDQTVLLSDGWTNTGGYCFHTRRYQSYSSCYQKYNTDVRATDPKFTSKMRIDTISIGNNFCQGSGWLGDLASKNEGDCSLIK